MHSDKRTAPKTPHDLIVCEHGSEKKKENSFLVQVLEKTFAVSNLNINVKIAVFLKL